MAGDHATKIKRANLDGSNVKVIKNLTSIILDIAIDTKNEKTLLDQRLG